MNRIKNYIYIIMAAVMTLVMAACSSDNDSPADTPDGGGMSTVSLRIGTANNVTRAADSNAKTEEMMNIWVVVITDDANAAKKVLACKPATGDREIDPIETKVTLPNGNYNFYSFANMSVAKVKELLGVTFTLDEPTTDGAIWEATGVSGTVNASKAVTVNGNGFDPKAATDNGFGSTGIPMSNKQTATVSVDMTKDLIVVRMLAKMEITITNSTGKDVKLNSAVLSGVTANSTNNLMLLPKYTNATNADKMDAVHGDIQPNLNGTPATVDYSLPITAGGETIANGASVTVPFYINESTAPVSGNFTLALQLDDAEYRYSVIDNSNATGQTGDWTYIARNDYRKIPVTLDDYKFELVPYDFPPIGVLPVSVSEVDKTNHIYALVSR